MFKPLIAELGKLHDVSTGIGESRENSESFSHRSFHCYAMARKSFQRSVSRKDKKSDPDGRSAVPGLPWLDRKVHISEVASKMERARLTPSLTRQLSRGIRKSLEVAGQVRVRPKRPLDALPLRVLCEVAGRL